MLVRCRASLLPPSPPVSSSSMRDLDPMPPNHLTNLTTFAPINVRPVGGPHPAAVLPVSPTSLAPSCRNSTAPTPTAAPSMTPTSTSTPTTAANWRHSSDELRRLRSRVVVLIERMLRNHQPHDVLTQVPENINWRSKTFVLALKIERLMFLAAPSRANYLNEQTLRSRVQLLSRHLVRIRKRKNAVASMLSPTV